MTERRGVADTRGTVIALLLAGAAFALFFRAELPPGERAVQWDAYSLHYPFLAYAGRSFQSGLVPLWSREIFCGYPMLAQLQMAALHPLHAAAALLRPVTLDTIRLFTLAGYLTAIWGMVALVRAAGGSVAAAVTGALAYGLSGAMLGHASHLGILECNALLPAALALVVRGGAAAPLLAGIVSASATLAGHFQSAVYGVTVVAGLIAFLALREAKGRRGLLLAATRAGAYVGVVASLTAVQSLPTAELAVVSMRQSIDYKLATSESLNPKSLATVLLPHRFGGIRGPYSGPWDRTNQQCYAGILAPLLALLAIARAPRRTSIPLAVAVLLGLLFALGDLTPVHRIVLAILPGFSLVRTPAAMMPMVQVGIAMLAALGVDRLPRRFSVLLPLLLLADLLVAYRGSTLSFVSKEGAAAREAGEVRSFLAQRLPAGSGARVHVWPYGTRFFPNEGLVRGIETTLGRASGLFTTDVNEVLELAKCRRDVLDLLRVVYAVDGQGAAQKPLGGMALGTRDPCPPMDRDRELVAVAPGIHRNDHALGVVVPVAAHRVASSHEEALALLREVDVRTTAVLEDDPGEVAPGPAGNAPVVTVTSRDAHELRFEVDAPRGAVYVVTDSYHPGWRAEMDGRPTRLLRADGALRAVVAPAGHHAFRLRFAPFSYEIGLFVSSSGLALLGGLLVLAATRS